MTTRADTEAPDAHQAPGDLRWPRPYDLSPDELRAEIRRCVDAGWRGWEIRYRFFSKDSSK